MRGRRESHGALLERSPTELERTAPRPGRARGRLLASLLSLGLVLLAMIGTAGPAQAAVTRSFSVGAPPDGDAWGTITWPSDYRFTATVNLYNDSGAAVSFRLCWWHFDDATWWRIDGCGPQRYNYRAGTVSTFTGLTASLSYARLGLVTVDLYVNGVRRNTAGVYR
ncbi:MAG TPA: hypothetical protein VFH03_26255 [Actinoplanes sp.]|nr:hypothetical protein [Actinoplanes sp.]